MAVDDSGGESGGSRLYQAAWVFYLLLAILAVVWIGSGPGLSLDLVIDPTWWWLDLLLGIGSAGVLIGLWRFGRKYLVELVELEAYLTEVVAPLGNDEIIALALISGFSEELFFRGAMQTTWGFGWATVVFALLHAGPRRFLASWTTFAALAALVFGGITLIRGTILAAVIGHMLVNAINLLLIRRASSPQPQSEG